MNNIYSVITDKVPELVKNASTSFTNQIDYFNNQEAFYTNEDIQKTANIKDLAQSASEKSNKEALKFILGVQFLS